MIWEEIEFLFRETALQLRRERLIAIATVSTVAVLWVVLGAIVLFHLNVQHWTERVQEEVEIRAYFAKHFPREKAEQAARDIAKWPGVRAARFVSKEEAMKWVQTRLPSSSALRNIGNPLPEGVTVYVHDPRLIGSVADRLARSPGIKDVVRPSAFVRRLTQFRRAVNWAGVAIAVLVAIAGIFIVHNTIRLALHARWREIYIMQLIGATKGLIAAPFLLEGLVHGLLGSAIACCLLVPAHMYLRSLSERAVPFFQLMPDRFMLVFGAGLLVSGLLLGLSGSAISIRRFLRHRPEWHT